MSHFKRSDRLRLAESILSKMSPGCDQHLHLPWFSTEQQVYTATEEEVAYLIWLEQQDA